MSDLRRRTIQSNSSPPSVDSVQQLAAALKQTREEASAKGLSEGDFKKRLGSAAEKNQVKLAQDPKSKNNAKPEKASTHPIWSKICLCYRAIMIFHLIILFLVIVFIAFPQVADIFIKLMHDRLYYIIRPFRLTISMVAPITSAVGWDFLKTDCLVENPLLRGNESCPCLHTKYPIELQMTETFTTIPESILDLPTHEVYAFRNAIDTSNVTLEAFSNFKLNHPTHRGPKTCMKLTTNGEEGIQKMAHLYDSISMQEFLNPASPWVFTWEECPTEERQQTFRSLLPSPRYLPENTLLSNVTVFSLGTQWGNMGHYETSFPGGSIVVVLIVMGEMRVSMDIANDCIEVCSPFRKQMVLSAGDILVFDQAYWSYVSVIWSKYAMTCTVAVSKP